MKEKISKCSGNCSMCAMNCGSVKEKKEIIGVKTALIIFAGILILSALFMPTESHMAGVSEPPEFELKPIIILDDDGNEIEITIDGAKDNHGQLCPGVISAFRQTQIGIKQLWGTDIPKRDDIKIISHFKDAKAPVTKGAPMKGRYDTFIYILNNTKNLEIMDCKGGIDCFKTTIIKKSTGEKFNISLKEDVIPNGFFELKKKMMRKNITPEEMNELKVKWEKFRDDLLTKTNHELFEYETQKKEPEPFSVTNIMLGGVIAIILISISWFIVRK